MAVAMVAVVAPTTATAAAGERAPARARDASEFSITISPARFVVPAKVGLNQRRITAYNTGTTDLDLTVMMSGFEQSADGTIVFGRPGLTGEASWVKATPASFSLPAGARQKVRLRIAVPAGAEPGEHSVGVVFLVPAETSADNLTLNRGVGSQLLVRVPGPVTRDVRLIDLDLPALSTGGTVPVGIRLKNAGTVHEDFVAPRRRIVGDADGQRLPFPDATVLAGVTRQLDTQWTHAPWLCHCMVSVSVPDGNGGTTTVSDRVWVLPLYQFLGGLLLVSGVVMIGRWRRNRHRSALEKARREGYETAAAQQQPTPTAAP